MNIIHPEMLNQLRNYYTPGTRVMLLKMNDPYTKLQPGDKGTVTSRTFFNYLFKCYICISSILYFHL